MTGIMVSIIVMAMVTMVVTRPGIADIIQKLSSFLAASIKATLGVDYE
jgi:hypothetical protein